MTTQYGIVDLFAGPGGLAEGFSAFSDNGRHPFRVRLSVEKDPAAHRTLLLRTFLREFEGGFPEAYYSWLNKRGEEPDWARLHPEQWQHANRIAIRRELGNEVDQRKIDSQVDDIRREFGDRTILIGGPPCQAYSLVGRARNAGNAEYEAKNDPRHFLYRAYIATLRRLKPAAFVMENVKGILSSTVDGVAVFKRVLDDLKAEGYRLVALSAPRNGLLATDGAEPEAKDFVIRAEEHGLPQARHRVIVVGIRLDREPHLNQDLCLKTSNSRATVRHVLEGLPKLRSGLSGKPDAAGQWADVIANALEQLSMVRVSGPPERQSAYDEAIARMRIAFRQRNEPLCRMSAEAARPLPDCPGLLTEWLMDPRLAVTLNHDTRGHMPSDLGRYLFAAIFAEAAGRSPKASEFPSFLAPRHANWQTGKFADRFRVQIWDAPATTVVSHISKDGHYFIHPDPTQCRSLTVREAARLQTFPDNYLFLGNRTEQYVQVGNAVPPLLAHCIASTLWQILKNRFENGAQGSQGDVLTANNELERA
ncbi:MAG: DNA cytosine methyltransferase [Beijerinckiaceae bacterium]|nr:DNA cytosine methyltransferase [Beijerinckiaceae bacterium]